MSSTLCSLVPLFLFSLGVFVLLLHFLSTGSNLSPHAPSPFNTGFSSIHFRGRCCCTFSAALEEEARVVSAGFSIGSATLPFHRTDLNDCENFKKTISGGLSGTLCMFPKLFIIGGYFFLFLGSWHRRFFRWRSPNTKNKSSGRGGHRFLWEPSRTFRFSCRRAKAFFTLRSPCCRFLFHVWRPRSPWFTPSLTFSSSFPFVKGRDQQFHSSG